MSKTLNLGKYIYMKTVIKENPDVREKALAHGMSFPYDEELLMMILGSGTKEMPVEVMARKILEVLDSCKPEQVVKKLMAVKGIGAGKALAVAAALELGKRRNGHLKKKIACPSDIVPFVRNYAVSNKEHFLMITLDGGYQIIQIHVVSVGTLNRALIHPREIFLEAIKDNATAMVLCHNHPSGDCSPSKDDIVATRNLLEASVIMGIEILDHIIVGCDNYYSFVENDLLFSTN